MRLVLEDGTELRGEGIASTRAVGGEVVFNTAMSGYVETLTDPSYAGQILVLTYPLVGNYGVPAPRPAGTWGGPYESSRIQVSGLILQSYSEAYSHRSAVRSLAAWLGSEDVPALTGIDTRPLTQRLREKGTMRGWILPDGVACETAEIIDMKREVFRRVAPAAPVRHAGGSNGPEVLLVDVGAKDSIVRSLVSRGASVLRAPWHADIETLARDVDGVVIGNGPGDPSDLGELVTKVCALLSRDDLPVFGICLGNQILALAAGGSTYKLPYGHRGVNQPVRDLASGRCYVTSQNHGYGVDERSLSRDWEPWFRNLNDDTNEGIRARFRPFFGVQFHPEAAPGPEDTRFLFDDFLRLAGARRRRSA